jgi:hypothetical protein
MVQAAVLAELLSPPCFQAFILFWEPSGVAASEPMMLDEARTKKKEKGRHGVKVTQQRGKKSQKQKRRLAAKLDKARPALPKHCCPH